ncbi:nuclear transport factor 2 family protein [Nocardia sp. NPDC050712]|uniref:YybH family protein n=1 Tax=Nocardia sp. NPDC050712 TaxID=3155518 RepID=UPI0033CB49E6
MPAHDTGERELRAQLDRIVEGLRTKDLDLLRGLYLPEVVSFDVEAPLQHVGVDAKMANWAKVFEVFDTVSYEFRALRFTLGAEVAFGHGFGRLAGTLRAGPAVAGMWVRATFGFRKIDGVWLIAHDQVSVPLDMATRTAVLDLRP